MIPQVVQILKEIEDIHSRKNADYAAENKQYENFERASELISWFNSNQDKAFVNHIATKLARLATLLNSNKEPNNESINDSFLDLCTYCILWYSFSRQKREIISLNKLASNQTVDNKEWKLYCIGCGEEIHAILNPCLFEVYNCPLCYTSNQIIETNTSQRSLKSRKA